MTTATVSQAGVEALLKVTPDVRVSQAGVEVLHRVNTPVSVSQAGVEVLHRVQPTFAVTQAGVEFLYKHVPCGTRWAQIWTIARVDGTVYRFTSLDRALEYPEGSGIVFQACDSLVPSASEAVAELGSAGTMDLSGAVGAGGISELALYAGLFDGAYVEAWLVPWDGNESAKALLRGTIGPVDHDDTGFKVELIGDGQRLAQTPLVSPLGPNCRWQFGDEFCQVDLGPLTVAGTIDADSDLRTFTDAARSETAGYFTRGVVTFTNGLNIGISAEIKEHSAGGEFTLWPKVAFPLLAGTTYSMVPGCTNLKEAVGGCNGCTAWNNLVRYGGFDKVPGRDKRTKPANAKAPD
jgi:uncharacterized phage protein (TIGR02218 family)